MPLQGSFYPPGDKSISHRFILLALLAEGQCAVSHLSACDDVRASLAIYQALGGSMEDNRITGLGGRIHPGPLSLDCGNSGTSMRLLCGVLAGLRGDFILDGDAQLRRRPMARVAIPLKLMGAHIEGSQAPLRVSGRPLRAIDYCSPLASAQVKSAVLLAGLNAGGVTSYYEPMPSRDHTEILLRACGAELSLRQGRLRLAPGKITLPPALEAPGDASGAAFFLTAAAFIPDSDVTALNMSLNPGRIAFLSVLRRMGAGVEIHPQAAAAGGEARGQARVFYNGPLRAVQVTEIPGLVDEAPILALAAAHACGISVFHEVGELAVKEVNRLLALQQQLGALGAEIALQGNNLIINGKPALDKTPAAPLDSWHDHRMAMTLAMALKACGRQLPVKGAESVSISYPDFFRDLDMLWR
jgi:3-phosphoshikimate 1-carboxyvinyltransferase